ncbi:cytochrome c biogenesis protein CcdA [Mycobacterium sp. CVI_P3]|uniref:Cytochrome c biogenesis protein CcdA n=1 Tax=Mycobacterium pinniadriaticum TaxID=2994102 RepID=A0ABT3S8W0_9MYCO|nr:cytochrome c biogenesis protein CcdA [Mycobacterium pinniadriaticum]MCX2929518.1 cytochrome c biogenesis protein CcdA [Mycobacterium pinniadriaticum]MCX2935942.1 cytochrome c biogenesis protein CcdA [Mycobacterium pinniadriaticum]
MDANLTGLALAAGMVAALNPCGFAMLPAYLTLVVRGEGADPGRTAAVGRALAATAAMALGFLAVFGLFGLLTVPVATVVQRYLPYATIVIGITLVILGVWLLSGRELTLGAPGPGWRWAPTARLGSMFGYGVGYAIASLSCTIGPFLAVTGSTVGTGSVADAVLVYAAYAAGLALVVGVLAVGIALTSTALVDRIRKLLPHISRISGVVLIAVGLYVGYYGLYEIRLLGADGNPADPIIAAAGRLQGALAGWVYRTSAWPWFAALIVLVAAAAVLRLRRARRHRR